MDIKETRKKSLKDLNKLLVEKREKLREVKFSSSNKQLKNVRAIRVLRKDVAHILTLIKSAPVEISTENKTDK